MEPKQLPDEQPQPAPTVTDDWGLVVPEHVDQPADVEIGATTTEDGDW